MSRWDERPRTVETRRDCSLPKVAADVIGNPTFRLTEFCLSVFACLMLAPVSGSAAEFTSVEVGYQRQALVGSWMPVRVSAEGLTSGQSVSLTMTSPDPRGNSVIRICSTGEVDSSGRVMLTGLGRSGRPDGTLLIQLTAENQTTPVCSTLIRCTEERLQESSLPIQRFLQMYRHDVRFLLTIGLPAGIDTLLSQAEIISPDSPLVVGVSIDSAEQLPRTPQAYDMFASILFTGTVEVDEQQFAALKTWIHAGGKLIISCTDDPADWLATPLGEWINARFDISAEPRQVTDIDLGALQQIVPRATRISTNRRRVNMIQFRSSQPLQLAQSGNGPLVGRIGCGSGMVTLVALDLSRRPLSRWNSLADFYAVLLFGAPLSKAAGRSTSSRISSSGVSDLATQLMATVDPVPESGRWTTWSVMALAFAWLLLIGPIDYLLVVILLRRPHLTWITFPVWVVAGFACLYSVKSGDATVVLNSVHLLDVAQDGDDHSIQALSLLSLSAPQTTRADLQAIPDAAFVSSHPNLSLTWAGRPEDVYGGMYRTTGIGGSTEPYVCSADTPDSLMSVPLLVDGSLECEARWSAESVEPLLESSLNVSGFGILDGAFQHHLPSPIHDWLIVYGNRLYRARDDSRKSLPAGQPWTFQPGAAEISDLKSWLVGERELREPPMRRPTGQSASVLPYSSRGRDVLDIVTIMSLYGTAGGQNYTGLSHHALQRVEVSDSIRLNYAVVIGWMEQPVTKLNMNGTSLSDSASMTVVRLLLPVDRRPARPTAPSDLKLEEAETRRQQSTDESVSAAPSSSDDDN